MLTKARCSGCMDWHPCALIRNPLGLVITRLCQECISLAYAEFLCTDVEKDDATPPPGDPHE